MLCFSSAPIRESNIIRIGGTVLLIYRMLRPSDTQTLHDKYKDNERVEISTMMVFVRQGETVEQGYEILERQGCNMPVYGIDQKSQLLKDCRIEAFPRVLILDKNRNVIFNGSRQFAERKLKELI